MTNTHLPTNCHSSGEIRSGWEAVGSKSTERRATAVGEQLGPWQNDGKNPVTSPCAHSSSAVGEDGWSWGHRSLICYGNSHCQKQVLIAEWISTGSFCANSLEINHLIHSWMGVLSDYGIWALCTVGCILILSPTPHVWTQSCGVKITISPYLVIVLPARSRV